MGDDTTRHRSRTGAGKEKGGRRVVDGVAWRRRERLRSCSLLASTLTGLRSAKRCSGREQGRRVEGIRGVNENEDVECVVISAGQDRD